jgi:hypothetical protein
MKSGVRALSEFSIDGPSCVGLVSQWLMGPLP